MNNFQTPKRTQELALLLAKRRALLDERRARLKARKERGK